MTDLWIALSETAGGEGVEAAASLDSLVAFELLTVAEDGWPHLAWLGPGEVLAVERHSVALALWPRSSTRANLERSGRGVLQAVADGVVYRARLEVEPMGPIPVGDGELAGFLGRVGDIVVDEVAYAEVLSGLTYRLHDPEAVLARWRAQIHSLTEAVARNENRR
jgi:hypothetical protein